MTERPPLSRRDLFRGKFLRGDPPPAAPDGPAPGTPVMRYPKTTSDAAPHRHRSIPIVRPPGAIDETTFLAECTRCNDCAEACPVDAIRPAPVRFREAAGTPMLEVDHQPCVMCADFPCIDACEPKVLTRDVPPLMGVARITPQACLAHQNQTCTVCLEHCPVENAIQIEAGRPRIDEAVCTGCGVCRHVCPAPGNAVLHMPTFQRPARPPREESADG